MTPPNLRLIETVLGPATGAEVRSVALIGNYPPRRCGIATFTADVHDALVAARPQLRCDVVAMTDAGEYAYPAEVTSVVRQDLLSDYLDVAAKLNADAPDVVCVQHEFGIFGGPAGEHLMTLLDAVDRPVVSTLHTVLERPNGDQRRVYERLIARSSQVIVMAERGREILRQVWGVPDSKIVVVPHGAPDTALEDTAAFKAELGFDGRELLFTFGLLSPNKGIETAIRALPAIVAARPTALYVVLGATHPHLLAKEGESYREGLIALAEELGVGEHVRFVDDYTDTTKLLRYLHAADIYITPYLNAAQITSGTLSYAAALGKPIVSTPYWHAEELLADGRGVLTPFGDIDAVSTAVVHLLSSPGALNAIRRRVYDATRITVWSQFAERYLSTFRQALANPVKFTPVRRHAVAAVRPMPSLKGVKRMTDSCGMLQHSLFGLPDRTHGYCVDDNARALILMHRFPGAVDEDRRAMTTVYASFVQHAWNEDAGNFRNFMGFDRNWLEDVGSQDSCGRAFWSVCVTAAEAAQVDHRRWAAALVDRALPSARALEAERATAFVILGLSALADRGQLNAEQRILLAERAARLADLYEAREQDGRTWFESFLSYDNARLPEAMLRAGAALGDPRLTRIGLASLEWLCEVQTSPGGCFRPVPTGDFGKEGVLGGLFDQQPLEAAATIEACAAALAASGDARWEAEAQRALDWFYGANDCGASLAAAGEGECYDGLTWAGPNQNQGAESVLSLQLAACALAGINRAPVRAPTKVASDT